MSILKYNVATHLKVQFNLEVSGVEEKEIRRRKNDFLILSDILSPSSTDCNSARSK